MNRVVRWWSREPTARSSDYFALVPLHDGRLNPKRTRMWILFIISIAVIISVLTFIFVPRGLSVGAVQVSTPAPPVDKEPIIHINNLTV